MPKYVPGHLRCLADARSRIVPGSFESALLFVMVEIEFRSKVGQVGVFEFWVTTCAIVSTLKSMGRVMVCEWILTPGRVSKHIERSGYEVRTLLARAPSELK